MGGLSLTLQRGNILLLLVAVAFSAAAAFWAYRSTLPPLSAPLRRWLGLLRFAAFLLLFLLLFDPLLTIESSEVIRPHVALLVDRSASMGIVDPLPGGEGVRRAESADRILREDGGALEEKLRRRYDVSLFGFASGLLSPLPEEPVGDATDLSRSLTEAVEAKWERGTDGIVLLSDGIHNAGRDPVRVAGELGLPVFVVPVGDPTPPRDLSLQQVLSNQLVYVKSNVTVEIALQGKGFAGEEVPLLIREGEKVVAEEVVSFSERREAVRKTMRFPVNEEGVHRYSVEVPVQEGERVEENNHLLFTLEAVKERLRLLVVAERGGWDFAFLRRSLERDPNVEARFFVQGKDGTPEIVGEEDVAFPYAEDELFRYDLVVVQGAPRVLSRQWGEALGRYVRARGGGLVYAVFGPLSSAPPPSVGGLLPVIVEGRRVRFEEAPFSPRLTAEGGRHPLLRLHHDPDRNRGLWEELPPLGGTNALGPLRPGASLLAVHPRLEMEGEELPVIALGTAGKGRVLLVNGAGLWRWDFRMWGMGKTNKLYESFWSNAVRWMVARGGFRNVTVKPEKMTYNRGEKVAMRGLVLDASLSPVSGAQVEVRVELPEGGEDRLFLDADPVEEGAYRREIGPYPPGDYRYKASATSGEALLGEEEGEFTVSDFSPEFVETERNDALLGGIARASGGRVLDPSTLDEWQGDLFLPSRTRTLREEEEIWNHPILFLLVVALFSSEWLIRKRRGLS